MLHKHDLIRLSGSEIKVVPFVLWPPWSAEMANLLRSEYENYCLAQNVQPLINGKGKSFLTQSILPNFIFSYFLFC